MKIWEMNLTITGRFQTCIVQPYPRDDGNQVNVPRNPRNPRYRDPWVVRATKSSSTWNSTENSSKYTLKTKPRSTLYY
jgi:hypothetical protein